MLPLVGTMVLSCETVIDVDLPLHELAITLNGTIRPDSTLQVTLTEDRFILDNNYEFKPISGATVQLFTGSKMIGKLEEKAGSGIYRLDFFPKPGVGYMITAVKEGLDKVEASDIIPTLQANASIQSVEKKTNEFSGEVYHLVYTLDDPVGKDYYEVRLYKLDDQYDYYSDEDTSYTYKIGKYLRQINYTEVGAQLNEYESYRSNFLFSDELFNGRKKESKIEFHDNRNYYYSDEPEESKEGDTTHLFLEVRHVSESYFKYTTTRQLHMEVSGNVFAEPAPVYNNVMNGFGIFAGYNTRILKFDVIHSED